MSFNGMSFFRTKNKEGNCFEDNYAAETNGLIISIHRQQITPLAKRGFKLRGNLARYLEIFYF